MPAEVVEVDGDGVGEHHGLLVERHRLVGDAAKLRLLTLKAARVHAQHVHTRVRHGLPEEPAEVPAHRAADEAVLVVHRELPPQEPGVDLPKLSEGAAAIVDALKEVVSSPPQMPALHTLPNNDPVCVDVCRLLHKRVALVDLHRQDRLDVGVDETERPLDGQQ